MYQRQGRILGNVKSRGKDRLSLMPVLFPPSWRKVNLAMSSISLEVIGSHGQFEEVVRAWSDVIPCSRRLLQQVADHALTI